MIEIRCAFTELAEIGSLKAHPKNRNSHPPEQIVRLSKLIEFQGFRHPIIVSTRSGYIVAGHGRYMAAKVLGMSEVPVDYQTFHDDDSEYAFLISDNAISDWSDLDLSSISSDLTDMSPDFDLEHLGLQSFTLDPAEKESQKKPEKLAQCPKCGCAFNPKSR